jgi:hypothetical protein
MVTSRNLGRIVQVFRSGTHRFKLSTYMPMTVCLFFYININKAELYEEFRAKFSLAGHFPCRMTKLKFIETLVSTQPGGEGREGAVGGKGAGPCRHFLAVGWRGPPAAFVL